MAGRWAFRFTLWFILVLLTQPQFRFYFLIPFHLADIAFIGGFAFHVLDCMNNKKPFIRFGPATKLACVLLATSLCAHYFNPHQLTTTWNVDIDGMVKVSLIVILLEAQVDTIYKAVGIMGTVVIGTAWWIKGGVRLAQAGMTWGSGDRLMGANVSIIKNPNDFAYLMAFMIPAYFYFFQITKNKYLRLMFLGMILGAAYIILETGSRTGFLTLISAGGCIALIMWKEHKALLGGMAASLVFGLPILIASGVISEGNINRIKTIKDSFYVIFADEEELTGEIGGVDVDAESAESRVIKARAAWDIIVRYPLGVGTEPRPYLFEGNKQAGGMVHNEILMAGRHMGFPGMFIYIVSLVMPITLGLKIYKRARDFWPEVAYLGRVVAIQALVVIVGGMFSPSLFHFPHMLMVTTTCCVYVHLNTMIRNQQANMAHSGSLTAAA